jgi:Ca2+-binding RTX toxin-like protein
MAWTRSVFDHLQLSDAVHAIGVIEDLTRPGQQHQWDRQRRNVITGNAGNNVLAGLGGADTLDGGTGTDTATYAASPAGVSVSLATGLDSGGDAQGDTPINIENLTGSAFNDTLEGNGGNNVLVGGAGIDTLSYEHAASGVTVSLATIAAQNTGAATQRVYLFMDLASRSPAQADYNVLPSLN